MCSVRPIASFTIQWIKTIQWIDRLWKNEKTGISAKYEQCRCQRSLMIFCSITTVHFWTLLDVITIKLEKIAARQNTVTILSTLMKNFWCVCDIAGYEIVKKWWWRYWAPSLAEGWRFLGQIWGISAFYVCLLLTQLIWIICDIACNVTKLSIFSLSQKQLKIQCRNPETGFNPFQIDSFWQLQSLLSIFINLTSAKLYQGI